MRKLKVFGGLSSNRREAMPNGGKQTRTIVAATSKKHAVELLKTTGCVPHISLHEFTNYWAETGNATELSVAIHAGVWVSQKEFGRSSRDYEFWHKGKT